MLACRCLFHEKRKMFLETNIDRAVTALGKMAVIWQERLDGDWMPPEGSGFPWVQVRLSLAALLPGMHSARGWVERAMLIPRSVSMPPPSPFSPERGKRGRGGTTVTLILAGNTPLLAWSPLCACLLAGVGTVRVKLSRDETVWTRLFVESLREADAELAARMEIYDFPGEDERTYALLQDTDAVIAYGSDMAIEALKAKTPSNTLFIGYGHAVSIGLVGLNHLHTLNYADDCARDVLMFNQQGCLSPHILYSAFGKSIHTSSLGSHTLPHKLRLATEDLAVPSVANANTAATVREARDVALFAGQTVRGDEALRWTVLTSQEPIPHPEPVGHCVVYISPVESPEQLRELLQPVWGILSCVGIAGKLRYWEPEWETVLREAGASRICLVGEMQMPPLDWQNGNRDLLADLFWLGSTQK